MRPSNSLGRFPRQRPRDSLYRRRVLHVEPLLDRWHHSPSVMIFAECTVAWLVPSVRKKGFVLHDIAIA